MTAARTHLRLVESCPHCAAAWSELGALGATFEERLAALPAGPPEEVARDELSAAPADVERQAADVAEMRRRYTRALEEKSELLRTPLHRRGAKIRHARRRFRSCLLAEMLLAESIARARCAPREALDLAVLVGRVLAWVDEASAGRPEPPLRVRVLRARAAVHAANAARICGELPDADRQFGKLRRDPSLASLPAAVRAEIDRLEASLRSDQRRFPEAEALLARAADTYRRQGDGEGLARTCIKQANLLGSVGRPEEMLAKLEAAAAAIDRDADPYLYLCVVNSRVNGLCDLDRHAEAARLLAENFDLYAANDDPHLSAAYRCIEGRVALGLGDTASAEACFAAGQRRFLELGRPYDAAGAALQRAHAMLVNGDTAKVRRLAAHLVSQFQSRGVVTEALRALDMIQGADTGATPPPPHSL